jgi:hypothetical protein
MFSWRAEGFSSSSGALYGGQGKSKLRFLIKKYDIFFYFSASIAGSGSSTNESGSETKKNKNSGTVTTDGGRTVRRIRNILVAGTVLERGRNNPESGNIFLRFRTLQSFHWNVGNLSF